MLNWLFPREVKFFDLFDKHAETIVAAAKELRTLVSDGADIPLSVVRIKDLEHKADKITHQCIDSLHKVFITPLDRDDIHNLIGRMDDIVDCLDGAARCIAIYKIKEMPKDALQLIQVVVLATEYVQKAVKGLRDLKNAPEIQQYCFKINQAENEADVILSKAIGTLFEKEPDTRLLIKWKEIYEKMEQATDRCEDVANIIDGIILELV